VNLTMNLYSGLNGYLLRSEKYLKQLSTPNKKSSSGSKAKERKILNVSHQNLKVLPTHYPKGHLCEGEEIDYSKIECLDCSFNQLTSLPDSLENCERLWCSNNKLTSLPASLPECRILWCIHNNLTSISGRDGLPKCKLIYCNYNRLSSRPNLPGCVIMGV